MQAQAEQIAQWLELDGGKPQRNNVGMPQSSCSKEGRQWL